MTRSSKQERAMLTAWKQLEAAGLPVKSVRISPVGDVFLLTDAPQGSVPSNDDADWVTLAGQKAVHRT